MGTSGTNIPAVALFRLVQPTKVFPSIVGSVAVDVLGSVEWRRTRLVVGQHNVVHPALRFQHAHIATFLWNWRVPRLNVRTRLPTTVAGGTRIRGPGRQGPPLLVGQQQFLGTDWFNDPRGRTFLPVDATCDKSVVESNSSGGVLLRVKHPLLSGLSARALDLLRQ